MEASTVQQQEQLFQKFENYDFEADANFQAGLKSIIGNNQNKSAQEQKDAVDKAKYFYYSRFVQSFDYNQYQAWRQLKSATSSDQDEPQAPSSTTAAPIVDETVAEESQSSTATAADPTYPKSFQEICELIASGKPIPGIRQIPNNLAEGTPSEAKLAPKLKPWEKKKAASAEEPVVESTTPSAEVTA
ncbi:hypothetical protein K457DRAFT_14346 [Linnemannia elongata AG-77]|uniref:Uncharacterized protein n=1 Tax=Linnemannia elongata AG-77 TaxID=1314771 RepID=A0A197K9X8_9FUNG|nr:hypothetical protein K457DRAFT_14346 [Linnemannia elongata AG-77]